MLLKIAELIAAFPCPPPVLCTQGSCGHFEVPLRSFPEQILILATLSTSLRSLISSRACSSLRSSGEGKRSLTGPLGVTTRKTMVYYSSVEFIYYSILIVIVHLINVIDQLLSHLRCIQLDCRGPRVAP